MVAQTTAALTRLKPVWNDRSISLSSKKWLMRSLVTSIFLCFWIMDPYSRAPKKNSSHGNEVLPQDTTHLIQRPCYNEDVSAKIQQAIRPHEDLTKTILQGTVKGGRRQGRQWKRWEDNIREWTGLAFTKSQRAVENREEWRKLVAKSSVMPQWPSRLRDW